MNSEEYAQHIKDKEEVWCKSTLSECVSKGDNHDWMPIAWSTSGSSKRVTELMCRGCFKSIETNDCLQFSGK